MYLDDEGNLRQCTIDPLFQEKTSGMRNAWKTVSTVFAFLTERLQAWRYHRLMKKISKTYLPKFLKRVTKEGSKHNDTYQ